MSSPSYGFFPTHLQVKDITHTVRLHRAKVTAAHTVLVQYCIISNKGKRSCGTPCMEHVFGQLKLPKEKTKEMRKCLMYCMIESKLPGAIGL